MVKVRVGCKVMTPEDVEAAIDVAHGCAKYWLRDQPIEPGHVLLREREIKSALSPALLPDPNADRSMGDSVAIIVAGQWQRDGHLKPGNIVRVCRDPTIEVS